MALMLNFLRVIMVLWICKKKSHTQKKMVVGGYKKEGGTYNNKNRNGSLTPPKHL